MADAQDTIDALAETVELAIGGALYSGWTSNEVTRSLDTLSGQFRLELAGKGSPYGTDFPVEQGARCELRIGGEVVINGWIDAVEPSADSEQHMIAVTGRDRTGDLADCSAIHKPGSWRNVKLETIAAELVKPFGLTVTVTAKGGTGAPIKKFAIQQGETVASALERLLRFRGLLQTADAKGNLIIFAPDDAAPVATLVYGEQIKSYSATHDGRERFSEYRVKGQAAGDDRANGKTVAQVKGIAKDASVARYRPLLVIAEDQANGATAATRAKWEAGVRAGKAIRCDITVLGWRVAKGGQLWKPNLRVRVKCAPAQLPDAVMLVSAVTLTKSDAGTIATLTVMPPSAWQQLAEGERQ